MFLRNNLAILNVDLEPASHKPGLAGIGKVDMVRPHNVLEIGFLTDSEVVGDVLEDNLDDGVAVGQAGLGQARVGLVDDAPGLRRVVLLLSCLRQWLWYFCVLHSSSRSKGDGEFAGSLEKKSAYHRVRHNVVLGQESLEVSRVGLADILVVGFLVHAGLLGTEDGERVQLLRHFDKVGKIR